MLLAGTKPIEPPVVRIIGSAGGVAMSPTGGGLLVFYQLEEAQVAAA